MLNLLIVELALVYGLGAITGPGLGRSAKRVWRRLGGRRDRGWSGYFQG
ncbi:hypothetical protein [Phenylobacterium sp.]|nr:hypothetical protein [Phenylobacterium sp.]MDP3659102.1 hypothetical protein [Phenylobacterium sp.]